MMEGVVFLTGRGDSHAAKSETERNEPFHHHKQRTNGSRAGMWAKNTHRTPISHLLTDPKGWTGSGGVCGVVASGSERELGER